MEAKQARKIINIEKQATVLGVRALGTVRKADCLAEVGNVWPSVHIRP